ncbi:unnamed protein product, partial [Brassica oleracea]
EKVYALLLLFLSVISLHSMLLGSSQVHVAISGRFLSFVREQHSESFRDDAKVWL